MGVNKRHYATFNSDVLLCTIPKMLSYYTVLATQISTAQTTPCAQQCERAIKEENECASFTGWTYNCSDGGPKSTVFVVVGKIRSNTIL